LRRPAYDPQISHNPDISSIDPDPVPFTVQRHERDGAVVVEVRGEIDLSTADLVREPAKAPGADRIVLDLRGVGFMDTSGIRLVVELMRAEDAGGARLTIVADGQAVLRLLDMAGLMPRLRIVATVDEALG
jgi:anti-sigma B factor antagonist